MHVKYLHHRIFAQRMHTDNFIVGDHEAKLDSVVNGLDELCPVVSNGRNYEWYYAAVNKRSPGKLCADPSLFSSRTTIRIGTAGRYFAIRCATIPVRARYD